MNVEVLSPEEAASAREAKFRRWLRRRSFCIRKMEDVFDEDVLDGDFIDWNMDQDVVVK